MKKILLVTNSVWNIINFRQDLINKIYAKKHNLLISAPTDMHIGKLNLKKFNYFPINYQRKTFNIFENLKIIFFYIKLIYVQKPSIILLYTIKPNIFVSIAALISFKKLHIYNFITGIGNSYFENKFKKKIIFYLYKIAFIKSTRVIFQNHEDLNFFIKNKIINKKKCLLIPGSGIDCEKFKFQLIKKNNRDTFNFLCISRLIKHKGVEEFIRAAKLIKQEFNNVSFTLIGSIDNDYSMQVDINLLRDFKKICNYENYTEDVVKYINLCDCFVLPSYREGTSRSLLEAAAVGRPIVTTDVPGCNNVVINNFNGYLCQPRDEYSLYTNLKKMINTDYETRKKMSINGRNHILKVFELNIVNKKILKTIGI